VFDGSSRASGGGLELRLIGGESRVSELPSDGGGVDRGEAGWRIQGVGDASARVGAEASGGGGGGGGAPRRWRAEGSEASADRVRLYGRLSRMLS
jgi:hypothetical protein